MKALQIIQPGSFSRIEIPELHLDEADPGKILVRSAWFSMCGSDIPFFTGRKRFKTHPRFKGYPLPWGMPIHECVGQVVESTSEMFMPGEWVVAIPENDQGLSEMFVAQASKGVGLPNDLNIMSECPLIQPLSTVINAVDRLGDVKGKSVAVIGLGSIGLFFCWLLKQQGASPIVGIDPIYSRCQMAQNLGADQTFTQFSIEVVHLAGANQNLWTHPEICIEAVGHQTNTINDCFELVRERGTVLAFGVPDQPVYALEYETFFRRNLHLVAVVTPGWREYLEQSRDLFLKHRDELRPLITHNFPIRAMDDAFRMYATHEDDIIKAIIDASQW
jgi:threonine dehydrogenase-like Zn-dependent dehydrogenase